MITDRCMKQPGSVWMISILEVTGLIIWLIGMPAAGTSGSYQGTNSLKLDYVLTITNPPSGQATVTMSISNLSTGTFEVEEHGYHGLYVNVLSLSAHDSSGNPLPVEHLPDSGSVYFGQPADVWRVQCGGATQIVIQYTVKPGLTDPGHGHRGYIAPDFAMLAGEYVFLVPKGSPADTVTVSFDLPAGWSAYTPWPRQGNIYDPSIPGLDVIESLSISDFALGQFDVYTRTIGTTEVAVAVYHHWAADVKEKLAQWSWRIFDYQTSVFGDSVGTYYLAIFSPVAPDGSDIYAGEWSTSQGYSIRLEGDGSFWGKWDMFAHQIFHRWNGWAWGMGGYYSWFGEGPNVLYEMKTITELRIARPYGDMEHQLQQYYTTYLNDYVALGRDRPLASWGLDEFLVYRKGAMVAFLMAKEIYLRTDGAHSFDEFLQVLFDKYGHYAAPCSEECLKTELAALTGTDFTEFFDDYVYGTETLPMDWAFLDNDGDGLSNALEIGWDTHPERSDSDGDGYDDAIEVRAGSDPLDPLSIPHLVYLPVIARDYASPELPINIDGEGQDWHLYEPAATDPQGDTIGGPHTDMKAVFAETDSNYAYCMVEAYDPPLLSEATIELNLDLVSADGNTWELHTNIHSDGSFHAWVDTNNDGIWEEYPISGVLTAWGNVMELRLPLRRIGNPSQVRVTFVNFWCSVSGQWRWVDMILLP